MLKRTLFSQGLLAATALEEQGELEKLSPANHRPESLGRRQTAKNEKQKQTKKLLSSLGQTREAGRTAKKEIKEPPEATVWRLWSLWCPKRPRALRRKCLGRGPLPHHLMTYLPERSLSKGPQQSSDFHGKPPNSEPLKENEAVTLG